MRVLMYSKDGCPHCDIARQFLAEQQIPFTETKLNEKERQELYNDFKLKDGKRTVPQIVLIVEDVEHRIGGAQELQLSGIKSLFP